MGYSGRYHAASLAAVFLALAVGILIGIGFGSDVVTGTAEDLERSLGADLDEANERIAVLEAELEREREFGRFAYPALVAAELAGRNIAVVALGGLDDELLDRIRAGLESAGARLSEIAVVSQPPDVGEAVEALRGERAPRLPRGEAFELAARRAGRLLVRGGDRFDAVRDVLLGRYSGSPVAIDAVVVVRLLPEDLGPRERADAEALEVGVIQGMRQLGVRVVGAEASDADPSAIEFFEDHGLSSVDNVDQLAGRVALVWALDGAEGSFGIKETADALLPEPIEPPLEVGGPGPTG